MSRRTPAAEAALQQIFQLMDAHGLEARDIKRARRKGDGRSKPGRTELILRLFTYIGGAFIFGGLATYVGMIWDDLGSLPRVVITLGSGIVAFIIGVIFAKEARFEKMATPAFIIAFFLQPGGLFVLLDEYFEGDNHFLASMVVFGPLALQQFLAFMKLKRTALALFGLIYGVAFLFAAVGYFEWNPGLSSLAIGLGLLILSYDLHSRDGYRDLSPFFYLTGMLTFFAGLYYFTGHTIYDPLNFAVMLMMLVVAVMRESRTLYVLSVLFIIGYMINGAGGWWHSWDWHNELATAVAGVSLVLAGQWLRTANYHAAVPLWFFFGSGYALGGAFSLIHDTPFEVAYVGIAALGVYAALLLRSRAALAVAILSLIGFIGYFAEAHFADAVGWPLLMILLGFMLVGAGMAFVRLSRQITA